MAGTLLLCWDCRLPIDEATAEQVKTNLELPEWMSRSRTRVCMDCALRRMTGVSEGTEQ